MGAAFGLPLRLEDLSFKELKIGCCKYSYPAINSILISHPFENPRLPQALELPVDPLAVRPRVLRQLVSRGQVPGSEGQRDPWFRHSH